MNNEVREDYQRTAIRIRSSLVREGLISDDAFSGDKIRFGIDEGESGNSGAWCIDYYFNGTIEFHVGDSVKLKMSEDSRDIEFCVGVVARFATKHKRPTCK